MLVGQWESFMSVGASRQLSSPAFQWQMSATERHAQVATRDRRGRCVMAYTVDGSPTHRLLSSHMAALEKIASERQVPAALQLQLLLQ